MIDKIAENVFKIIIHDKIMKQKRYYNKQQSS